MCFIKTPKISRYVAAETKTIAQDPIERKEAVAASTKNSQIEAGRRAGYMQNIKTSTTGLEDEAQISKKTLLGE